MSKLRMPRMFAVGIMAALIAGGLAPNVDGAAPNSYFAKKDLARMKGHGGMRKVTRAVAVIQPTAGSSAKGTITLSMKEKKMVIEAVMSGLTPGEHGFHFHQYGDCSSADGAGAGPHFSPLTMEVGAADKDPSLHHHWDLGVLMADADGNAKLTKSFEGHAFCGPGSVLGTSIIVHAQKAGARVGCGVVGAAKE